MLIGEVSRLAGISTRMLRHYDSIGLVSPTSRTANGYRNYTRRDIDRLFRVESLRTLGLSLQTIAATLADTDLTPTEVVDELILNTRARIVREQALVKRLNSVRASGAASWKDVLDVVALMQELTSPDPARRQSAALTPGGIPPSEIVDALLAEKNLNVAGALQWALTRSGGDAMAHLADALDSPDEHVRRRAVAAIVKMSPDLSGPVLIDALHHPDGDIRERVALALGSQGVVEAVPELLDMIVRGSHDVDAAEMLGRVATAHQIFDRIAGYVDERLSSELDIPGARSRLTQALADVPGPAARRTLAGLVEDDDHAVAMTARYLLTVRTDD